MKEDPGAVWRKLWGVNAENSLTEMTMAATLPSPLNMPPQTSGEYYAENSLTEMTMAATLPSPLNMPPQTSGEYRGRKVAVSGSVIRAIMLFPTSFAPLPKARTNKTASPMSAVTDISLHQTTLFRRNTFHCSESRKREGDICRLILLPLQYLNSLE